MTGGTRLGESGRLAGLQRAFTGHIRDPSRPLPAGVEDRRMAIYRDLLYRNVANFMADSYPVLRRILPDDRWHALMRDYFREHEARTPLFPSMPQELLHYLERERGLHEDDPPFLFELAHYEWIELAASLDKREIPTNGIRPGGDPLEGVPVPNPIVWCLRYRYPVHRIGPSYLPTEAPAESTYLAVCRGRAGRVRYLELNAVSARLLDLVREERGLSGRALLEAIVRELNLREMSSILTSGRKMLERMRDRDLLLGVREDAAATGDPLPDIRPAESGFV